MASHAKELSESRDAKTPALPQEMQRHTYAIMRDVEDTHWWFAGRRRILRGFLQDIVTKISATTDHSSMQGERATRILDVGCGTGANLETLAEFGAASGVDISAEALDFCRARGLKDVRLGAAEKLPYPDESYDIVTALDVVEHLDDDVAGLREMRRVLRRGGYALLFVPAFMFLWGVQDDVSHHRRRYTLPALKRAASEAGLTIERATYANLTFFAPILAGRALMRLTGARPASENNVNIAACNNIFGRAFGAERFWLRRMNLPLGVSAICVARRDS